MTIFDLVIMVVIAGVMGAIAARILGLQQAGLLFTTFFGFLGLLLGRALVYQMGFPEPIPVTVGRTHFPLVWSVVGGLLTTLFGAYLARRRRKAREKRK